MDNSHIQSMKENPDFWDKKFKILETILLIPQNILHIILSFFYLKPSENKNYVGQDLSDVFFQEFGDFSNCDFSSAILFRALLENINIDNSTFDKSILIQSRIGQNVPKNASFKNAYLYRARLTHNVFNNCNFYKANMKLTCLNFSKFLKKI